MSPAVLLLTVCFVSLVYGKYQSGNFIYKGQVPFTNRESTIKEIFVPSDDNGLIYCGLQCVKEPECLAIEMCPRKDRQLCRLCNSTNPSFTENETDSCLYLQLDYKSDRTDTCSQASVFHTCKAILSYSNCGMVSSGVYSIDIDSKPTDVWCDMETDRGGWTVIQRRLSGSTDFYRSWNEYKSGFGNVSDNYWLDDCFWYNSGKKFSTKDSDNDWWSYSSCAVQRHSGWWHGECTSSNLNGLYHTSGIVSQYSMACYEWTGSTTTALKSAKMIIR